MAEYLQQRYPTLGARFGSEDLYRRRMSLMQEVPQRAHDMTWLRTEALRRFALEHGHAAAVGDEAFEVFIAARHEVTLFDDVAAALQSLSRRYVLATFSNGNADVHRIGLGEHFAVTLNAEKVGHAKPHVAAFQAVADALGMATGDLLYVGDEPRLDVQGARAAGCRSAWINRRRISWPADLEATADLVIEDLLELDRRLPG
jgi:putative hydrolase of the HAD superfamily